MSALERFAELLVRGGQRVVWHAGRSAFKFTCPLHDDRDPSCDATVGDHVPVIASCMVCGPGADLPRMLEELGASEADRDAILGGERNGDGGTEIVHHDYRDSAGQPLLRVVRELRRGKTTRVLRQYWCADHWCWPSELPASFTKPDTRNVLYNVAAVTAAARRAETVYIGEGERVVDALIALGLPGTCNAGGASQDGHAPKWTLRHAEQLRGAGGAVIFEDNDRTGRAHAQVEASTMHAVGTTDIRMVRFPHLPERADLVDWLATVPADERRARLDELIARAERWSPPEREPPSDRDRLTRASLAGPAILEHEFERRPPLLGNGIISAGDLVLIFGRAKAAKTWITALLGLAMADAKPWFGITTTAEATPVGFLELELLGDAMQDRLKALTGCNVPETFHLVVRPVLRGPFDLVDRDGVPVHLDQLRAWIEARRLKVVIVDALARATSCDQHDFSPLLLVLDHLRADLGVSIILVHHEGKPPRDGHESDDLNAMRGDSRLSGFPQAILRVVKKAGNLYTIRFAGVSNGPTPDPLWFSLDPDTGVPRATQAPESVAGSNRDRIARVVLEASDPVTRSQVETRVRLSKSTVASHLKALVQTGEIEAIGKANEARYARPGVRASEASEQAKSDGDNGLFPSDLGGVG